MPTQLVVEFPSRLRATSPRVRRELALGAGTALALSALTVALGVVLTSLVVFTGSWPGFAPGTGGEATLATTASRDADAAPAPTRRPAAPVIAVTPVAFPTSTQAATAAPVRRARTASHHRRVDRVRRQATPRRTTPTSSTPAPAAAAPAPAASGPGLGPFPVGDRDAGRTRAVPVGRDAAADGLDDEADHPPDHDDLAVLLVDVDVDVDVDPDVDHVHRHDRAPQPAAVAPRAARAAAPCSGRDARPRAGSAAGRLAAGPARPAGRTRPAGARRSCAGRRPSRSRRSRRPRRLARPAPLTQPSRAFTDGRTSVAMSSIERRASAGSTQSVPQ